MLNRLLGLLFFLAILAVLALNFKKILIFSQAQVTHNAAAAAIKSGNWDKAIEVYEAGRRQSPDNVPIALSLGWLYQRAGRPQQAEGAYRSVLRLEPASLDARIGLAYLMRHEPARVNEAVDTLRDTLRDHPADPALLAQIGDLYKDAAENKAETRPEVKKWLFDQARYYYELSVALAPKDFQTNFNLGVSYHAMKNWQPAARAYCRAVVINPESQEARYNLGLVLSDLDYLDEAYRQMNRAVRLLEDKNQGAAAQAMAQRVQNVKSKVYYSTTRQGLSSKPAPPFLDPRCLEQATDAKAAEPKAAE